MKSFLRLAAVAAAAFALALPAAAQSVMYVKSDPGDEIGLGATVTHTAAEGPFTANVNFGDVNRGITIHYNWGHSGGWDFAFAAPNGVPLTAGSYPVAERFPVQSATKAGLDIVGNSSGCNTLDGRFLVHEIVMSGDTVVRFAADFEQRCTGAAGGLKGSIRFNSAVPLVSTTPVAFATAPQFADAGTTVTLNGSTSSDPGGSTLTYAWSQVSGTAASLSGANSASASFVAPAVPLGGSDLVFELRVTNAVNNSATARVTVHVANPADPKTFLQYRSEAGHAVGLGRTLKFTPQDGVFEFTHDPWATGLRFLGGTTNYQATFAPPQGGTLAPGDYFDARDYPSPAPQKPGLEFYGDGRSCDSSGSFRILELVVAAGVLQRFAVDFEQHCNGTTPALFGAIRYKSSIPVDPPAPVASAVTTTPEVDAGAGVRLDGSASRDPGGASLTYSWSQLSGTPANLGSPNSAVATFTAPAVPAGGSDLVFQLTVTNTSGRSTSARTTVHVLNANDPHTFFVYRSDPGDYIGGHLSRRFTPNDGEFTTRFPFASGGGSAEMNFHGTSTWWTAQFTSAGGVLVPGTYESAERASFHSPGHPGLDIGGEGRGCNTLTGRFVVHEAVFDGTGTPTRLAIDFEQHCEGAAPAMFGGVRYKSAIPYVDTGPRVATSLQKTGPAPATSVQVTGVTGTVFTVRALDSLGQPVASAHVTFAVQGGCGTLGGIQSVADVVTDSNGVAASPTFSAGSISGVCVTRASVASGASVDFETLVYDSRDITLVPYPSLTVASVTNRPFEVGLTVLWRGTVPLVNERVTALVNSPTPGGPGFVNTPVSAMTDASGRAIVTLMANGVPGTYTVTIYSTAATTFITVNQSAPGSSPPPVVPVVPQVQDMWWSGPAENGWGMSVVQHGETLFAVIYGYDAQGAPTWWVLPGGSWDAAKKIFTAFVYAPHSSPFYAYDASRFVVGAPLGTVTLTFADAAHATLDYAIGAVQGTRRLERLSFGLPGPPGVPAGIGRDDMYWGGEAQNGWGISVIRQFSMLFAVWYTYDANGVPTWFVMPGGNWVQGSPIYEGRLYRATGSPWLAPNYDASRFVTTDVGTFRMRFDDQVLEYTVDGRSGSMPFTKTPF